MTKNKVEMPNGGCLEWDSDDSAIRHLDRDGNCVGIWRPGEEGYDAYKNDFFPYKDVPNLDSMFVDEVEAYYLSIKDKEDEVWKRVKQYALSKSRAMRLRLPGNVVRALFYERCCDAIYHRIKDHLDW